jgi:glycosyltransferase involved in cell wall biosynthesis
VDVVYYTHPAFFEPALSLVQALSRHVRVHLLLEISAGAWQSAMFDARMDDLPSGIVPADPILAPVFPAGVREFWQSARSFHLVSHPSRRSFSLSSLRISRDVLRWVADLQADILHLDDVDVSPRLALALPRSKTPAIVISVHDPEPHSGEANWRKTFARRIGFRRAKAFVLYNAAARKSFASHYAIDAARVHVTRFGPYDVIRAWSSPAAAPSGNTVVFFGRLSPYKGLEDFYRAIPLINRRIPDASFRVAGRPIEGYTPPHPPLLPPPARIDVIERYLAGAEAAALLRDASVVVCPYRDASQSGVVLSAFAFDVPVVATDVGGLPEYVLPERTGLVVPAGDAEAIADGVCRILLDGALAARLRDGIRHAPFSWDAAADAIVDVYRKMGSGVI